MTNRIGELPAGTARPEPCASATLLESNLAALARVSPRAAESIRLARPRQDMGFVETEDGAVGADIGGRALCSRRRPLEEARCLADGVDLEKAGTLVVMGFGVGHHVAALAERAREVSALVVFEPDVEMLRAVFERVDHSGWISEGRVMLETDAANPALLSRSLRGMEGALAIGVEFVEHPPSRGRLGEQVGRFAETFTRVFKAVRTHVVTTMVQTDVTVRNELMNLGHYLRWPGVADLAGAARGRAAIVVSAGPSLRRNIDLLKTPGLRDRCVIVCVQTVLRQLLAEGIRPHFVTAIDYHEISKRFYEGLESGDVEGVTLVCEARANPAILDAYAGPVRMPQDEFLTQLLGWGERPDRGTMIPAATVAHLAYYLARHLGADPVILVGQDLAFTDGQYYARGAAIHDVWGPELNAFNTLEMMEWQRIVRMRGTLHEATDHLGRRVYTDEQMATYLAQFERDFLTDLERGLSVVDATEGGVAKAHTTIMGLAEAIARYAGAEREPMAPMAPAEARDDPEREREVRERLGRVRAGVRRIARGSREARDLIRKMARTQRDVARTNRLIDQVNAIRDEVQALEPAFGLVMRLNQMGALKRFRADRLIKLAEGIDGFERQRRQIDRDAMNLDWIGEFADLLDGYIEVAASTFDGGAKITRDLLAREEGSERPTGVESRERGRVVAVIGAEGSSEAERGFLGRPVLGWTLSRLARCTRLDGIVITTADRARVEGLVRSCAPGATVEVLEGIGHDRGRAGSIRAGRAWADCCWRGGLGGLTVFDEAFDPAATLGAMERVGAAAAVVVGPAWGLVDPVLADELVERHLESPEGNALTFTQAPPGLAPAVVGRALVEDLAHGQGEGLIFASIAGALGYVPTRPRGDPIAHPCCVQIDRSLRGSLGRFVLDDGQTVEALERALGSDAKRLDEMDAGEITSRWRASAVGGRAALPREVTLELTTARPTRGDRFGAVGVGSRRGAMEGEEAARLVEEIARVNPDARLTLAGLGDPLEHPGWLGVVESARAGGIAFVHVRTDLLCGRDAMDALAGSPVDVISVDVLAHRAETYARIAGVDRYRDVCEGLDGLLRRRETSAGMPRPWIVPRITRRDAVYEEVEVFFDKWILLAGAAMIDQLSEVRFGERIEPLWKPRGVVERDALRRMTILSDGSVVADELGQGAGSVVSNVFEVGVAESWSRLVARRASRLGAEEVDHEDLRTGW